MAHEYFYIQVNRHLPKEKPEFGIAVPGEQGYYDRPSVTPGLAETLNKSLGNSELDIKAATLCSMFDSWENFAKVKLHIQEMKNR